MKRKRGEYGEEREHGEDGDEALVEMLEKNSPNTDYAWDGHGNLVPVPVVKRRWDENGNLVLVPTPAQEKTSKR